jgi:hypothetical protein
MFNLKQPAKKISLVFFAVMFVIGMVMLFYSAFGTVPLEISGAFRTIAEALFPYWVVIALGVAVTGAGATIASAVALTKSKAKDEPAEHAVDPADEHEQYGD